MNKSFLLILLASLFSINCYAGTIQCSGKVAQIGMHANDKIMLRLSSMNRPVFICSMAERWEVSGTGYKTTIEMCKALYSMFLTAKTTGAEVGDVWMDGDDANSCSTFESWKRVNIRHFMF